MNYVQLPARGGYDSGFMGKAFLTSGNIKSSCSLDIHELYTNGIRFFFSSSLKTALPDNKLKFRVHSQFYVFYSKAKCREQTATKNPAWSIIFKKKHCEVRFYVRFFKGRTDALQRSRYKFLCPWGLRTRWTTGKRPFILSKRFTN